MLSTPPMLQSRRTPFLSCEFRRNSASAVVCPNATKTLTNKKCIAQISASGICCEKREQQHSSIFVSAHRAQSPLNGATDAHGATVHGEVDDRPPSDEDMRSYSCTTQKSTRLGCLPLFLSDSVLPLPCVLCATAKKGNDNNWVVGKRWRTTAEDRSTYAITPCYIATSATNKMPKRLTQSAARNKHS